MGYFELKKQLYSQKKIAQPTRTGLGYFELKKKIQPQLDAMAEIRRKREEEERERKEKRPERSAYKAKPIASTMQQSVMSPTGDEDVPIERYQSKRAIVEEPKKSFFSRVKETIKKTKKSVDEGIGGFAKRTALGQAYKKRSLKPFAESIRKGLGSDKVPLNEQQKSIDKDISRVKSEISTRQKSKPFLRKLAEFSNLSRDPENENVIKKLRELKLEAGSDDYKKKVAENMEKKMWVIIGSTAPMKGMKEPIKKVAKELVKRVRPKRLSATVVKDKKVIAQYHKKIDLRQARQILASETKELRTPALSSKRLNKLTSPDVEISLENVNHYKAVKKVLENKWTTRLREKVQDKMIRVRKLVRSPGMKVSDKSDPYLAETLMHGRVHTRLLKTKRTVKSIDQDIVKKAKGLNKDYTRFQGIVNKYLIARHAPERNLKLGKKAAGITTKKAKEITQAIEKSSMGSEVKLVADRISKLNKQTLDTLYKGQVIDKELYTLLNKTYKHHVPLNRIMAGTDDVAEFLTGGKGISIKATGLKRAKGSERQVSDILENVTANVEQAVVRVEKNRVGLSALRFARDNKMVGGLFEEVKPKAIGKTFEGRIIQKQVTDPLVLTVREHGKPVYLKINDEHLAAAFQGINTEYLPHGLNFISRITRFYSSLATRFNPEFAFSNIIRDLQENVVYMSAQKKIGFTGAVKTPTKLAMSAKNIVAHMRGKKTPGAKLYAQMLSDGGSTGGMALSTRERLVLDIAKIRKINQSNPRKATQKFLQGIENWNQVFEDANRLSSYRVALSRGFSRDRAAQIAKESTVNFNRKGTLGPIVNSLYMFSNASIQGSAKMLMAMKDPKVAAAVVTSVAVPVVAVSRWNESIDPEWRDKVTEWDRISNLPILIPQDEGVKYVTIPVSWGLKPIMALVNMSYDTMAGKSKGLKKNTELMVSAITEAYNPLGGTDIFSNLMPTIGDIPADIVRNRAWYGAPIAPTYNEELPESERYYKSIEKTASGRTAKKIAQKLSVSTNREIELNPEHIDYAFRQMISGAGKFVSKTINVVASIGKEEKPRPQETPVVSRFLKKRSEEEIEKTVKYKKQDEFFDKLRKKETGSEEQKEMIREYLKSLPDDEAREKAHWNIREGGFSTKGISKSLEIIEMKPIYNEIQTLLNEDKKEEADARVTEMSDEDFETFKKVRSTDRSQRTRKVRDLIEEDPKKAVEFIRSLRKSEQTRILNLLSDNEYAEFELGK